MILAYREKQERFSWIFELFTVSSCLVTQKFSIEKFHKKTTGQKRHSPHASVHGRAWLIARRRLGWRLAERGIRHMRPYTAAHGSLLAQKETLCVVQSVSLSYLIQIQKASIQESCSAERLRSVNLFNEAVRQACLVKLLCRSA